MNLDYINDLPVAKDDSSPVVSLFIGILGLAIFIHCGVVILSYLDIIAYNKGTGSIIPVIAFLLIGPLISWAGFSSLGNDVYTFDHKTETLIWDKRGMFSSTILSIPYKDISHLEVEPTGNSARQGPRVMVTICFRNENYSDEHMIYDIAYEHEEDIHKLDTFLSKTALEIKKV